MSNSSNLWDKLVKEYSASEGQSYRETMLWLSSRDSLETAASLIGGIPENFEKAHIKDIMTSLGSFLEHRGYAVPRLWCKADNYAQSVQNTPTLTRTVKTVESEQVKRTRENYLQLRVAGYTRSDARRKMGLSHKGLYYKLDEWGLRDRDTEGAIIMKMRDAGIESTASSVAQERLKPQREYKRSLRVNIELTEAVIKESINALVEIAPDHPTGERESITDTILYLMACARNQGVDIAGALVQKLREVSV